MSTDTEQRPSLVARFRGSAVGYQIERAVRLALIGAAVVKVADKIEAYRRGGDAGCGCLDPEAGDALLGVYPVVDSHPAGHETSEEALELRYSALLDGDQFRRSTDDEWRTVDRSDGHQVPPATMVYARHGTGPGSGTEDQGDGHGEAS